MAEYADKFRYSSIAPPVGSTSANFPINPIEVDWQWEEINNIVPIMDGEPVVQKPLQDSRIRKMIWRGWRINNPTIVSLISAIENNIIEKNFWFIDGSIGRFSTWTRCRGLKLRRRLRSGGGKVTYAELVFEFIVNDENFVGW